LNSDREFVAPQEAVGMQVIGPDIAPVLEPIQLHQVVVVEPPGTQSQVLREKCM